MEEVNFNPKDIIFSLDIGTRSVIGTVGIVRDKKFTVLAENYIEHQERAMVDGQIHDISLVASAVNTVKTEIENKLKIKLRDVAIAAAGRFLRTVTVKADINIDSEREIDKEAIRSLELTAVKKAEEKVNKQTEGKLYCVGYSVKSYYLNNFVISNLLSHKGEYISAEVIATFLPRGVVDSLYAVMEKVGLNVVSLTLEPIAAMEAAIPQNLRLLNLALVDIGAGTSDIAISSKDSIVAYGMVPQAGDEVTEAIAQTYLVDFNTAEIIKRESSVKDIVVFKDILGFENEIKTEEIINTIRPVVDKIAAETSEKIMFLNGGKAPNAVFLVGGGAHTPLIKEFFAEKLNIPLQRIGIRGRTDVVDCICLDNDLGSIGVTVLGIALVSIKRLGNDFIDVHFNGSVISLFNSHKHTVLDVMLQAGINPKVLMAKNGKNIRFTLNGNVRLAFGTLAKNAVVKVNNKKASVDTELNEGDKIQVDFAVDGEAPTPKIFQYIPEFNPVAFYINGELINLEPIFMLNNKIVSADTEINEGDEVSYIFPKTFKDFKTYFKQYDSDLKYSLNDVELEEGYEIKELDDITAKADIVEEKPVTIKTTVKEVKVETIINEFELSIIVNENRILLKGKEKYVFIDIFDYIDFDLSKAKGTLVLTLNGNKAGYYDQLTNGDNVVIKWE